MKKADIIIPHHNRHDHLKNLLDCIDPKLYNVAVVMGGTFAENCNRGARLAQTNTLIFVNDDVILSKKTLRLLAEAPEEFVSCTEFIPQEGKYFYGIGFKDGMGFKAQTKADMVFPCGFLFKITRDAWERLGGFDEEFKNGGEDGDLGIRAMQMGITVGWIDEVVTHYHSQSDGRMAHALQNREYSQKKWAQHDVKPLTTVRRSALVGTNHLDRLGGTETWTRSMVAALRDRMDVDVYATQATDIVLPGVITDVSMLKKKYDFIIMNHNTVQHRLRDIEGLKIFTSHGIFPQIEEPHPGADRYVAISEEVRTKMIQMGFENVYIIRNGIDTERYKPTRALNRVPQKVLCLCQGEKARAMVKEATHRMKMQYVEHDRDEVHIEREMNAADIVVTLGRGALEAMACGRVVFVFDSRGYMGGAPRGDGIVKESNWEVLAASNFSGRARNLEYTVDDIVNNFRIYEANMGPTNRNIVVKHFNIHQQVEKYLKL